MIVHADKMFNAKQLLNISYENQKCNFIPGNTPDLIYDLIFVEKGILKIMGDNPSFLLKDNELIILDHHLSHLVEPKSSNGVSVLSLRFSISMPLDPQILSVIFSLSSPEIELLRSIAEEYDKKDAHYVDIILCNLTNLLVKLIRQKDASVNAFSQKTLVLNDCKMDLVHKCLTIIDQHINNPDLNVTFLSDQLFVSTTCLYRLFRKYVQTSINEYIQNLRIEKAQDLLQNSFLPVTEISEMLGFCSQCYFSTQFKKKVSMTPSEFRLSRTNAS